MTAPDTPTASLHHLYSDHHSWLQGWLRARLGNAFDAADLAHDTYVRLLGSGRLPQPGQSRAFLAQIAKGLVVDLYRRRRIESAYLEALAQVPEGWAASPEEQAMAVETLVRLDALLGRLPARVRTTFLLSQFDGLTYSHIALRLKVSVACVRKDMLVAARACCEALGDAQP